MSSEEDIPAQQEPLCAALVEDFQAVAEPSVTEDEEDVSAQQELPHPALVEVFQVAEPSVTANGSSGHLQGDDLVRIRISNILQ